MVACEVLCVKTEMVARFSLVAIFVVAIRYVHLASENWLDLRQPLEILLGGVAGVMKRLERKEVSVVGYRNCRHSPPAGAFDQRVDLALPVKQGICGVQMEMYEIAHVTSPRS